MPHAILKMYAVPIKNQNLMTQIFQTAIYFVVALEQFFSMLQKFHMRYSGKFDFSD